MVEVGQRYVIIRTKLLEKDSLFLPTQIVAAEDRPAVYALLLASVRVVGVSNSYVTFLGLRRPSLNVAPNNASRLPAYLFRDNKLLNRLE
jgi:hypothetical protein